MDASADLGAARSSYARQRSTPLCIILLLFASSMFLVALAEAMFRGYRDNDQTEMLLGALLGLLFLAFSVSGGMIAGRFPRNPVGWLLFAPGVMYFVGRSTEVYAWYLLTQRSLDWPGRGIATWASVWVMGKILLIPLTLILLLFPSGELPGRRWRSIYGVFGVAALIDLVSQLRPGPIQNSDVGMPVPSPLSLQLSAGFFDTMTTISFFFLLLTTFAAFFSLIPRYRRSSGVQQLQLKWLVLSGVLVLIAFSVAPVIWTQFGDAGDLAWSFIFVLSVGTFPLAVGIALLKYRLYDIDFFLSRALIFGLLTAAVIGGYALIVGVLNALLNQRGGFASSLFAAGTVAVLFQPGREFVQRGVNRLVYGDRDDPYLVLSGLGKRLEGALAPEAVLPAIVSAIGDTLRLSYAAVALPGAGGFVIVAANGTPAIEPTRFPLTYGSEQVGELLVSPHKPGELFGPRDKALFVDLARQIGVAAHAVQLTTDLQRAREHLVSAREEERRRLRRDLHDGIGAQLAALGIQTGVLQRLINTDPAAATVAATDLKAELKTAVAEIRRVVHGLRPPALDELGLVEALRRRVTVFVTGGLNPEAAEAETDDAPLSINVLAPPSLPELPAAVEVAVYRIVEEALTNVVKHARAKTAVVRIESMDELRLTIEDDGIGVDPSRPSGVGLISMRERTVELSGSFSLDRRPGGGTSVNVRFPLLCEGAIHGPRSNPDR